jgi:hypothetical protein
MREETVVAARQVWLQIDGEQAAATVVGKKAAATDRGR